MLKRFKFLPGIWFGGVHRYNHICMDCKYSSRLGGDCPFCNQYTIWIGDKWRIPKKNDKKGWEKLKQLAIYKAEISRLGRNNESSDSM